jgi:hypothetical protein
MTVPFLVLGAVIVAKRLGLLSDQMREIMWATR